MKVAIFTFSLFGINTYVVYDPDSKKAVIIDPGMINDEEESAMAGFIKRNGLKVTNVINTHLHIDHAIGNKRASKMFDAPILAHADDQFLGARLREQAQMFGIAEKIDEMSVSSYLNEGDVINVGNGRLKVIHVPGHSPGGIALYDEADGFVIVGDSLFESSVGRTDLPGGNHATLINAVKTKLMTLPPNTVVYPGHGAPTTIGREKAGNPFLV
ncbi:MAG: MBL fold metallo-hydrolase [Muribaculaceae bacterium]|nr:MBL fold metallo-hydrolase [Muribaculaceae bacterium]